MSERGDGLVITASGVTIDLNGHQIGTWNRGAERGIDVVIPMTTLP